MRSLLFVFALFMVSFSGYSQDLDSPPVNVKRITAVWAATTPNGIYSYTFSGLSSSDSCGKNDEADAVSGDSNINRILQMAYSLNERVKVGIDRYCVITGVMLEADY